MTEIDPETVADGFGIRSLAPEDGAAVLTTVADTEQARALVLAMSDACGRMLDDDQATNYVEFEVMKAERPAYVVHVRRAERPTPHQLRREAEARVAELEAQLERADDPCPHDPVGYVHAGPVSVHSCAACRVRVEGWVQWRTGERATFTEFPKEAGR